MADVIPMPLGGGESFEVLVEVAEAEPATGREQAAVKWRRAGLAPPEDGEAGKYRLEQTLEQVRDLATKVFGTLRAQPQAPDEITLEFGIKLTTKAEAYIASAAVETNFKVTLAWKPSAPAAAPETM